MATAEAQATPPRAGRVETLKRRSEFLRTRKGTRAATPCFVLEAKRREETATEGARFGFTVSKAVGNAVERNRIKRRLKAAVRDVVCEHARRDFDYVLIARRAALDVRFAALVADLVKALKRAHAPPGKSGKAVPRAATSAPSP